MPFAFVIIAGMKDHKWARTNYLMVTPDLSELVNLVPASGFEPLLPEGGAFTER